MKLQTVHVRVNDTATGQPTPVRIRFTGPDGSYYAPFSRLTSFALETGESVGGNLQLGETKFSYIDGTCEIALPPGTIKIEAYKGPEYEPLVEEIDLPPGKLSMRLAIERWANLREEGWYSGDTRVHFLTPHTTLLEAAAEDVAVANLLALYWQPEDARRQPPSIPNIDAFSGFKPTLAGPGHMVTVNTYNMSSLGHVALLNCHRVVYPLQFETIDWTLADWCDQCHRKNGGLVVWSQYESWYDDPEQDVESEAVVNLILGQVDAVETTSLVWCERGEPDWYSFLNAGLQIPLVGASGKASNSSALGAVRTYAHLDWDVDLTYSFWIEAVRAGRTFVTNGPLVWFSVADRYPGSVVDVLSGSTITIRALARSIEPFERLQIVNDGAVIAEVVPEGPPYTATIEKEVPVSASGWFAARCWGKNYVFTSVNAEPIGAHTSPVYVRLDDRPMQSYPDAIEHLQERVERFERMLQAIDSDEQSERNRQQLLQSITRAREALNSKLS